MSLGKTVNISAEAAATPLHHFYGHDDSLVTFKNNFVDFSSVANLSDPNGLGVVDGSGDYVKIQKSGRYRVRYELKRDAWGEGVVGIALYKNNVSIYHTYMQQETTTGSTETILKQEIELVLDLSANDELKFWSQTTTSRIDCVLEVYELPTKTVIPASTLPTDDQSASGYMDIGDMRMQWGTFNPPSTGTNPVTLPAAFKDATYTITTGTNAPVVNRTVALSNRTTTQFDSQVYVAETAAVTDTSFHWQAIGLKP